MINLIFFWERVKKISIFQMDENNSVNDVIIHYVREHPMLYDKSLRSYRNNNARNKLWETMYQGSGASQIFSSVARDGWKQHDTFQRDVQVHLDVLNRIHFFRTRALQ